MRDYFEKVLYGYVKRISGDAAHTKTEIRWMNYMALYSLS